MKVLNKTIPVQSFKKVQLKVTNVIHDLPVWMFTTSYVDGKDATKCVVCNQDVDMAIGHGEYLETCSMIQLDNNYVHIIHRHCYDELEDVNQ